MIQTSIYLKIAEDFKKRIKLGALPPGSHLPDEIELAKNLSVTRKTLRNAFGVLEHEKLIVRKKRFGTFISENAPELVKVRFEIYVAGNFKNPEETNFFISSLTGDSNTVEAFIAVHKLLSENISLRFISSGGVSEIPDGADGFIIVDSIHSSGFLKKLADKKVPHIAFETHLDYPGVNTVMADDEDAVRQSIRELYKKGHRKIAFLGGPLKRPELNTGIRRRTEAFKSACEESAINCKQWTYNFDEALPGFDLLTDKLLSEASECSAAVCALGKGALSLLTLAEQRGIKIPGDIEMICIDSRAHDMLPDEIEKLKKYPGFFKPRKKIAEEGLRRLFDWIGNDNYIPKCHKVSFESNNNNREQ